MLDAWPPVAFRPQPVTVATLFEYSEYVFPFAVLEGRQIGATAEVKVSDEAKVSIDISNCFSIMLKYGWSVIEATALLSASMSPTSCSPTSTWMLGANLSLVQCAAVSTCLVLMMLPPHHGENPPVVTSPT